MRIIAGSSKGKTLFSPPETTRPTSDRAREGLFSSLESEFGSMQDLNVLDLFSGSGAVGVEALSRGAANVFSVEQHEATARVAQQNFELVTTATGKFTVINSPAMRFVSAPHQITFDFVFMDPPYELSNQEIDKLTMTITTLEQNIKKNNIRNNEIQSIIDLNLIQLQALLLKTSTLA